MRPYFGVFYRVRRKSGISNPYIVENSTHNNSACVPGPNISNVSNVPGLVQVPAHLCCCLACYSLLFIFHVFLFHYNIFLFSFPVMLYYSYTQTFSLILLYCWYSYCVSFCALLDFVCLSGNKRITYLLTIPMVHYSEDPLFVLGLGLRFRVTVRVRIAYA